MVVCLFRERLILDPNDIELYTGARVLCKDLFPYRVKWDSRNASQRKEKGSFQNDDDKTRSDKSVKKVSTNVTSRFVSINFHQHSKLSIPFFQLRESIL